MSAQQGQAPVADGGGSAFPATNYIIPADLEARHVAALGKTQGMTLRDYFAAKAMQGFLAEAANPRFGSTQEPPHSIHWPAFASDAYGLADAMLAARGVR